MNEVSLLNLKLLKRAPFVATVALHAEVLVREHPGVEIAATDGKRIYLSPTGFSSRPIEERMFIYAHEVLHCALSHVSRRGTRDPRLWNIAADIVVNGLLIKAASRCFRTGKGRQPRPPQHRSGLRTALSQAAASELWGWGRPARGWSRYRR